MARNRYDDLLMQLEEVLEGLRELAPLKDDAANELQHVSEEVLGNGS